MESAAEPLISQLNLKNKKLSKSHQKIADYIEKHYDKEDDRKTKHCLSKCSSRKYDLKFIQFNRKEF